MIQFSHSIGFTLVLLATLNSQLFAEEEIPVQDCRTSFVHRATLSSERVGIIAVVPREGDVIDKDETVIRLRDDVSRAMLKVAQTRAANGTQIEIAETSALVATAEYDAALKANQVSSDSNPAFPPTHMTRLRLSAEAARLEVEAAKHEKALNALLAKQAQAELQTYRVIAPMNGLVTQVFKRAGEGVQQGESIIQVVNTETMRIEGYVTAENANSIHVGMPVRVRFEFSDDKMERKHVTEMGTLGFVDVSVQTLSGVVRVWTEVDNQGGRLREGLKATMTILSMPKASASQQ